MQTKVKIVMGDQPLGRRFLPTPDTPRSRAALDVLWCGIGRKGGGRDRLRTLLLLVLLRYLGLGVLVVHVLGLVDPTILRQHVFLHSREKC